MYKSSSYHCQQPDDEPDVCSVLVSKSLLHNKFPQSADLAIYPQPWAVCELLKGKADAMTSEASKLSYTFDTAPLPKQGL